MIFLQCGRIIGETKDGVKVCSQEPFHAGRCSSKRKEDADVLVYWDESVRLTSDLNIR